MTGGGLKTSATQEIKGQSLNSRRFKSVARVAELADAPDSKSGPRKGVWVRLPPLAP